MSSRLQFCKKPSSGKGTRLYIFFVQFQVLQFVLFFSGFQSEIGGEDSVIDTLQNLMRSMSETDFSNLVDELQKKNSKTYKTPNQQVNSWADSQSPNSYPSYLESFLEKKNLDIDTRDLQDDKNYHNRYSKRKLYENEKREDLREIISLIEDILEEK